MEGIAGKYMSSIELLSNETIDKIAAGEVVEKPLNVVKELVENSIDAKASAITIEIKGGGIELIRVTDNGCGIPKEQCQKAFLRHATSKISSIDDLNTLSSLGFRGEALSSICAVSKTEMITKTEDSFLGTRTTVEGGSLIEQSDIGAPNGTTIVIRSLFYNTPARKKFLKSDTAEAAAVEDLIEKLALSNPAIAFSLIINGKTKISTTGNGNLKDVIYAIYGKDVYNSLLEVDFEQFGIRIKGFTAKPEFSYQARNGELYFVNGRYVKSKIINTSIEEVYRKYLMQHRFPFCILDISISPDAIDINVHPQKLDIKFSDSILISDCVIDALNNAFNKKELIPEVTLGSSLVLNTSVSSNSSDSLECSDKSYIFKDNNFLNNDGQNAEEHFDVKPVTAVLPKVLEKNPEPFEINRRKEFVTSNKPEPIQETFFDKKLLDDTNIKKVKIIGQVFDTYWIMELDDEMYIVDQHAAHEKVNYEHFVKNFNSDTSISGQMIAPPVMLHLTGSQEEYLKKFIDVFFKLGFEIDDFGMHSYAIRAVPSNLYGIEMEELFYRLLDELCEKEGVFAPTFVLEKLASLSCKAAIKGNQKISFIEMENLMNQLLKLDNPYNCPHGRPVFIKITKQEMEKKFKRIV